MEGQISFWEAAYAEAMPTEIDRLMHYVSDRREMVRYPKLLEHGWQIGSGPMQSQCRVVPDCVKGAEMRWDADNAEAVMALQAIDQSKSP